jgi:thymidine phosphorylase
VELYIQLNQRVEADEPLCCVHAETPGELRYALDYASANPGIIEVVPQ